MANLPVVLYLQVSHRNEATWPWLALMEDLHGCQHQVSGTLAGIIYFIGEIGIALPEPQVCGHSNLTCISETLAA
jgi:hypothetical protein